MSGKDGYWIDLHIKQVTQNVKNLEVLKSSGKDETSAPKLFVGKPGDKNGVSQSGKKDFKLYKTSEGGIASLINLARTQRKKIAIHQHSEPGNNYFSLSLGTDAREPAWEKADEERRLKKFLGAKTRPESDATAATTSASVPDGASIIALPN